MVTRNVDDLASSFESIVDDRDVTGAATVALAGAAGGVVSQQIANQVLPMIGYSARPTGTTGLAVSGVTKVLVGAGLGYAGIVVGDTPGMAMLVAGVGAAILGGGDLISSGLSLTEGGVTAGLGRQSRNLSASNRSTRTVRSSGNTSNGRSRSSSSGNTGTAVSAGL